MEVERERLKLRDDPKVISPPSLDPAWKCGTAVVVRGFIANAKLDPRSTERSLSPGSRVGSLCPMAPSFLCRAR